MSTGPRQKRNYCPDCQVEWIFRTPDAGPPANCPKCGSPNIEVVEYNGLFDFSTKPADVSRVMGGLPLDDIPVPAPKLLPDTPPNLVLVAASGGPSPCPSPSPSWPPDWLSW